MTRVFKSTWPAESLQAIFRPFCSNGVKLAIAALSVAGSAIAHSQTVTQYTERALPGDPINIMGDGFNGPVTVQMAEISATGATGTWTTCKIVAQSEGVLQIDVPTGFVPGVWALRVYNATGVSATVYVNRPEIYFLDSTQASPNGSINIYGRNLEVIGTNTIGQVKFVAPSGATLNGTVTAATPYCYTVSAPAGIVPGTTYSVEITNGFAGALGQTTAPTSILAQPAGTDPFKLGVWWGPEFTFSGNVYNVKTDPRLVIHAAGDGVTNDLTAIQNAITAAGKAGGGVVYLPTGTYQISNGSTGLNLASNVVLKGDGSGSSIIEFGSNWTPQNPPNNAVIPIRGVGLSLTGLYGLGINNLNTSATQDNTILLSIPSKPSNKVFVSNCNIQTRNGIPMQAPGSTNLLIQNNLISTLSTQSGPLMIVGSANTTVEGNTVCFRNGRIQFQFDTNLIVTNNSFKRDNNFMTPNAIETGCLELSCDRLDYVNGNVLAGLGPFPNETWCGEMINTQRSNCADEEDLGKVTSATSTTLTNSLATWETSTPFSIPGLGLFNRAVVCIVAGKGAGQWRTIASNTAKTLELTQPWADIPDATSTYTIGFWAADRLIITNNSISNSMVGVEFWEGANGCVVDSNTITNSGKILLRCEDCLHSPMVVPGPMKGRRHDVGWDNWIANNTVTNTSGNIPAAVSVYGRNTDGTSFGNLVFGTEVRNNTVNAHVPNTAFNDEGAEYEGYWNFVKTVNGPNDPYANFATLIVGNQSTNITAPYNTAGAGLLQVILKVYHPILP